MLFDKFPLLQKFIDLSRKIPYVPSKHTYPLVEFLLHTDEEKIYEFVGELVALKKKLCCAKLVIVGEKQKPNVLGVLKKETKIFSVLLRHGSMQSLLKKANMFDGIYHILGEVFLPEGITYEKLSIGSLIKRINTLDLKEIIIATNQTPEGEATSYHIERVIKKQEKILLFLLFQPGIPVGTSLAYVDRVTLVKALHFRRKLK